MKIFWRSTKWISLTLLGAIMLYALLALILSWWSTNPPVHNCLADKKVYITSTGIHLDVVIPAEELPEGLLHVSYEDNSLRYAAFGWGERNFYLETPTWADLTLSNGAQALLVNSEPIMHITRYATLGNEWKEVKLCEEALQKLFAYIEDSFRKTEYGQWTAIAAAGYTEHDFFYEANGQYNAITTCNTWLNNALKAAEVKTSRWSPMTYGILYHLGD
jgi:uncharacterized protein (TIGR02117 family)